jgi:cation transporter-like permease
MLIAPLWDKSLGITSSQQGAAAYAVAQAQRVGLPTSGGRQLMPLLQILITLIVVGVLLWLVNRFIPMQGTIKSILNAVVVIAVVLWLLNIFGLFHSFSRMRVGQ